MCGISGIVNKNGTPVTGQEIAAITDPIAHRGPDGHGYYHGPDFALGHRRLSIIDLSELGRQPMEYLGRYCITYNGEIYNYLEVRAELQRLGHEFRSATDTEVILAAYHQWGADCLRRFNGMWAFAIYDAARHTIFLARDRFGVKPLYYSDGPDAFVFGSEIKQLLVRMSVPRANRSAVIEAMLTSFDGHTDETYFEGVQSFPQSHWGYYDFATHRLSLTRWYDLAIRPAHRSLTLNDSTGELRELFEDAVRLRLRSDVRVGTCLSGGLDSSATSGVASRLYHSAARERFIGIHARSIDPETDESRYAERAADHLGVDLHTVTPGSAAFLETMSDLVRTQEEPFGSPSMFMGWHVFQEAQRLGCKVMLNGQGGDEVLLGYERYFAAFLSAVRPALVLREMLAQARNSRLSLREVLQYRFYFTNASLRIHRLKARSFLRPQWQAQCDFGAVRDSARAFRDIDRLQIHEIGTLQLPHLLRYEDRNSMRHSIETRLPFLDYRVVEFCISIPAGHKIHDGWTKYVLRRAMEDVLPPEVTWRRDKLGFQAPERTWMGHAGPLMKSTVIASPILAEITDHERLVAEYDRLPLGERWRYFMLAIWARELGVDW